MKASSGYIAVIGNDGSGKEAICKALTRTDEPVFKSSYRFINNEDGILKGWTLNPHNDLSSLNINCPETHGLLVITAKFLERLRESPDSNEGSTWCNMLRTFGFWGIEKFVVAVSRLDKFEVEGNTTENWFNEIQAWLRDFLKIRMGFSVFDVLPVAMHPERRRTLINITQLAKDGSVLSWYRGRCLKACIAKLIKGYRLDEDGLWAIGEGISDSSGRAYIDVKYVMRGCIRPDQDVQIWSDRTHSDSLRITGLDQNADGCRFQIPRLNRKTSSPRKQLVMLTDTKSQFIAQRQVVAWLITDPHAQLPSNFWEEGIRSEEITLEAFGRQISKIQNVEPYLDNRSEMRFKTSEEISVVDSTHNVTPGLQVRRLVIQLAPEVLFGKFSDDPISSRFLLRRRSRFNQSSQIIALGWVEKNLLHLEIEIVINGLLELDYLRVTRLHEGNLLISNLSNMCHTPTWLKEDEVEYDAQYAEIIESKRNSFESFFNKVRREFSSIRKEDISKELKFIARLSPHLGNVFWPNLKDKFDHLISLVNSSEATYKVSSAKKLLETTLKDLHASLSKVALDGIIETIDRALSTASSEIGMPVEPHYDSIDNHQVYYTSDLFTLYGIEAAVYELVKNCRNRNKEDVSEGVIHVFIDCARKYQEQFIHIWVQGIKILDKATFLKMQESKRGLKAIRRDLQNCDCQLEGPYKLFGKHICFKLQVPFWTLPKFDVNATLRDLAHIANFLDMDSNTLVDKPSQFFQYLTQLVLEDDKMKRRSIVEKIKTGLREFDLHGVQSFNPEEFERLITVGRELIIEWENWEKRRQSLGIVPDYRDIKGDLSLLHSSPLRWILEPALKFLGQEGPHNRINDTDGHKFRFGDLEKAWKIKKALSWFFSDISKQEGPMLRRIREKFEMDIQVQQSSLNIDFRGFHPYNEHNILVFITRVAALEGQSWIIDKSQIGFGLSIEIWQPK